MRAAILAIATIAGLAALRAAAAPAAYPFSFEEVDVAPGIHAFIEKMDHAVVSGNSVVIEGDDGLVVVDTGHHPRLTRRMVERIRALTPKPVRYVVNTHWHNDHVSGNSIFAEAFPDARFVAQSFTAGMLESEIRPYMGERCVRFLRDESAPLR